MITEAQRRARHAWLIRRQQGITEPRPIESAPAPRRVGGPGTELRRLLEAVRIPTCGRCLAYAAAMDAWGPEGCEARLPEIVAHLAAEAAKQRWLRLLPFKELGAEGFIREALAASQRAAIDLPANPEPHVAPTSG